MPGPSRLAIVYFLRCEPAHPEVLCKALGKELEVAAHCDGVGLELRGRQSPCSGSTTTVPCDLGYQALTLRSVAVDCPELGILPRRARRAEFPLEGM